MTAPCSRAWFPGTAVHVAPSLVPSSGIKGRTDRGSSRCGAPAPSWRALTVRDAARGAGRRENASARHVRGLFVVGSPAERDPHCTSPLRQRTMDPSRSAQFRSDTAFSSAYMGQTGGPALRRVGRVGGNVRCPGQRQLSFLPSWVTRRGGGHVALHERNRARGRDHRLLAGGRVLADRRHPEPLVAGGPV
jgi:hypothetical protein